MKKFNKPHTQLEGLNSSRKVKDMKEIAKVTNKRFYETDYKEAEIKAAIAEIREVDKTLNVLEEKVAPYGFYIPMREIIDSAEGWRNCTRTSRAVLIAELNGCIDIVNHRIQVYNEKDITVRFLVGVEAGAVKTLKESTAKAFIQMGIVELEA